MTNGKSAAVVRLKDSVAVKGPFIGKIGSGNRAWRETEPFIDLPKKSFIDKVTLEKGDGYALIELPKALLEKEGESIAIQWCSGRRLRPEAVYTK